MNENTQSSVTITDDTYREQTLNALIVRVSKIKRILDALNAREDPPVVCKDTMALVPELEKANDLVLLFGFKGVSITLVKSDIQALSYILGPK